MVGISATPTPTPTPSSPIQLFLVNSATDDQPIVEPSAGQLGVNNLSLPFTTLGQQQYVLVYEPGFTGTFSATPINCYDYAVTSPTSPPTLTGTTPAVTVNPPSSVGFRSAIFTITSVQAGICNVKISDSVNGASILVDVTTTTGTISSIHRHI